MHSDQQNCRVDCSNALVAELHIAVEVAGVGVAGMGGGKIAPCTRHNEEVNASQGVSEGVAKAEPLCAANGQSGTTTKA